MALLLWVPSAVAAVVVAAAWFHYRGAMRRIKVACEEHDRVRKRCDEYWRLYTEGDRAAYNLGRIVNDVIPDVVVRYHPEARMYSSAPDRPAEHLSEHTALKEAVDRALAHSAKAVASRLKITIHMGAK